MNTSIKQSFLITVISFLLTSTLFGANTETMTFKKSVSNSISSIRGIEIIQSDREQLHLELAPMKVKKSEKKLKDGNSYSQLQIKYTASMAPGEPDLPVFSNWITVPNGKSYTINADPGKPKIIKDIEIAPVQYPQPDSYGLNKKELQVPFALDSQLYKQDQSFPGKWAIADKAKEIQGQNGFILRIYPFQYNPVHKELKVYPDMKISISFEGKANHTVSSSQFSASVLEKLSLNGKDVNSSKQKSKTFTKTGNGITGGCDYLIICDPTLSNAADTLAAWKRLSGYRTKVVSTATAGTVNTQIDDYIEAAQSWSPAPQFILLLGDADLIPCFYEITHASDAYTKIDSGCIQGKIATDRYYGETDLIDDQYPDLHVGRIPANDLAEATAAVNHIIEYEQTPPDGTTYSDYYLKSTMAAFFQDNDNNGKADRRFCKTAEDLHEYFRTNGYTPQRQFCTNSTTPTTWATSSYYEFENGGGSGEAIPAELQAPFAWDGDKAGITSALNNGTFFMFHRDHGSRLMRFPYGSEAYTGGWADPEFHSSDVSALSNGSLRPVVFSINCMTGWFDNETDDAGYDYYISGSQEYVFHTNTDDECLAERFMMHSTGGAVGVVAPTRISYSGPNDRFTWGLMDAIWPNFIESKGGSYGNTEPILRLSQALEYASAYLQTQYTSNSYLDTAIEEYQYFGDPTMEIRTKSPLALSTTHSNMIYPNHASSFTVNVMQNSVNLENARVTLSKADTPDDYWTGETNSAGDITFSNLIPSSTGTYNLIVTASNSLPYQGTVTSNYMPTISITSPAASPIIANSQDSYAFSGTASDSDGSLTAIEYRINSGSWISATGTNSWSFTASGLPTGDNLIEVRAKDNQNTYSIVDSRTVTRNQLPILTPDQTETTVISGYRIASLLFSGTASDTNGSILLIEYRVDNGSWVTASGTSSWNLSIMLSIGKTTLEIRAQDDQNEYSLLKTFTLYRGNRYFIKPGGGGSMSGSSWANAFATLTKATAIATENGDEVWVAAGTYSESATLMLPENVTFSGGFSGSENSYSQRNILNNQTIIDGENTRQCVDNDGIINGFYICNGLAGNGAGIYNRPTGSVENVILYDNQSTSNGAGIYNQGTVCNALLYENTATLNGGGIYNDNGTIQNCTIYANTGSSGAGIYNNTNTGTVINTISWGNHNDDLFNENGVRYSCFGSAGSSNNNCSDDPMFVNTSGARSSWDFRLIRNWPQISPCIDTGLESELPDEDLEGCTRCADGNANGTALPDMGAFEFSALTTAIHPEEWK